MSGQVTGHLDHASRCPVCKPQTEQALQFITENWRSMLTGTTLQIITASVMVALSQAHRSGVYGPATS